MKSKRARHSHSSGSGFGSGFGIELRGLGPGAELRRPPAMTDGPGTGAPPATSRRRRMGHSVVVFAIGSLAGNRAAAKVEIVAPGIAARPTAVVRGERDDLPRQWTD